MIVIRVVSQKSWMKVFVTVALGCYVAPVVDLALSF